MQTYQSSREDRLSRRRQIRYLTTSTDVLIVDLPGAARLPGASHPGADSSDPRVIRAPFERLLTSSTPGANRDTLKIRRAPTHPIRRLSCSPATARIYVM